MAGLPYYNPPLVPENYIHAETVTVMADQPRLAWAQIHTELVQLASRPARVAGVIDAYRVHVAIRIDHKDDGTYYSIAATPGSEDTQVIYHDLFFPECIAYGSTGSPEYRTEKVEVDSGAEQRNQRRIYPRHKFNIELNNLPANEISEILNLWHVCAGDAIGFLFLDPMDHTSFNDENTISGSDVTSADQLVADAIGTHNKYPLYKYYKRNNHDVRRLIRYPKLDTLLVEVDGHPITSWAYDYDECLLEFLRPRLETTETLSRDAVGVITGDDFSALSPGDLVYVSGWSNAAYNALPGADPARVLTADATSLTLQKFNGTAYGAAVMPAEEVEIYSALPPTGSEIRAGFYYYIAVRFEDGDNMESAITAGLRESSFADFPNVSLREIFE